MWATYLKFNIFRLYRHATGVWAKFICLTAMVMMMVGHRRFPSLIMLMASDGVRNIKQTIKNRSINGMTKQRECTNFEVSSTERWLKFNKLGDNWLAHCLIDEGMHFIDHPILHCCCNPGRMLSRIEIAWQIPCNEFYCQTQPGTIYTVEEYDITAPTSNQEYTRTHAQRQQQQTAVHDTSYRFSIACFIYLFAFPSSDATIAFFEMVLWVNCLSVSVDIIRMWGNLDVWYMVQLNECIMQQHVCMDDCMKSCGEKSLSM